MNLDDILEPYERLIEIKIGDTVFSVPENNSILRCLQFLDMENISFGRSARAIEALRSAGFTGELKNLRGGITAWSNEVDPKVPKY